MTLHYTFNDISCDVLESSSSHINNGWFEPHYHREQCEIDYDYEIEIDFWDFLEFMKPDDFKSWKEEGQVAFEKACHDIWYSEWIALDALEEDDAFVDYMTEKYKNDAHAACEEEYED